MYTILFWVLFYTTLYSQQQIFTKLVSASTLAAANKVPALERRRGGMDCNAIYWQGTEREIEIFKITCQTEGNRDVQADEQWIKVKK